MKAYGLTLLRVTVGALYLLQAYRLLTVVTPPGTAGFIGRAFGLPNPGILAWILIAAHGLGGLMLVAGVLTRGAAAVNALIAAVVLARVHVPPHGLLRGGSTLIQSNPAGAFEYGVLLAVATVVVLMLGSGPLALRPSK
jgi:putative oxidoreductase